MVRRSVRLLALAGRIRGLKSIRRQINAKNGDNTAFCTGFGLCDAYKFYFAGASADRFYSAICVKFISSTISVCMIARAVMWLNLKEKNEYSFYGNARVCG
nr:hypothetical protein [uncultured Campylobacter sp.]